MSDNPIDFAGDAEAAKVLQFIKAGLWRKARDAAKVLCKKERARYLDLLIQANVGLVREMLAKGLVKEAETVVEYLATIAPADILATLRVELSAPVSKRQVATLADSGGAGWWLAALRADEILMKSGAVSPADLAALDLLVTDAFEPTKEENDERSIRLAAELRAVRSACAATGEGRWEEAKEGLRSLPRQSVFSAWRIFLRGVRCFFEEERETARQCFAQLPHTGALARAAASLAPDLAACSRPAPVTATIPFFLAATGQQAAWAAPILAATISWKNAKRLQAFDDLALGMKKAFPSVEPGLPALLTDAVLPSQKHMNQADWTDSEALYSRFVSEHSKASSRPPASVLAFIRSMCLAEKSEMPPDELHRCWSSLIALWQKLHGQNKQRDSLAWQWLGETMGEPSKQDGFLFSSPRELKNKSSKAVKAYENAVAADDANEEAWLGLASLLASQGDTKRSNRMVDDLVKKFPQNKGILMLAGGRAISRKSYAKGITILRSALVLDPLDKDLKERIVVALMLRAREASRKGEATTAFWVEIEPLLENTPPTGRYMLCRWMARVSRSLLDACPDAAVLAEADAIAMAPSSLIRLFFSKTLASVYGLQPTKEWDQAWTKAGVSPECTWKSIIEILRILDFINAISGWNSKHTDATCKQILKLVEHLLKPKNLKADPAGLLAFVNEVAPFSRRCTKPASDTISFIFRDISDAFYDHVNLAAKRIDPHLRLSCLLVSDCDVKTALKSVKMVIADAEADGLSDLATQARNLQKTIESQKSPQPFGFFGGDDDDDYFDDDDDDDFEDEEDEEDEEDDEADDIWEASEDPSPIRALSIDQCLEDLKSAISSGNAATLKRIRDELLGAGVGKKKLDQVIRILTQTIGPASKKAAKKDIADPLQIDLF